LRERSALSGQQSAVSRQRRFFPRCRGVRTTFISESSVLLTFDLLFFRQHFPRNFLMAARIRSAKHSIALGAAIHYGIGCRLGVGRRNLLPKSFLDLNTAVDRGAIAHTHWVACACTKASTYPLGEPSFLRKCIRPKQLHSASTLNCRIQDYLCWTFRSGKRVGTRGGWRCRRQTRLSARTGYGSVVGVREKMRVTRLWR